MEMLGQAQNNTQNGHMQQKQPQRQQHSEPRYPDYDSDEIGDGTNEIPF